MRGPMNGRSMLVLGCVVAVAAGCRPDDQRTESLDVEEAQQTRQQLPPELVAHLDSGSAAYRRDAFETSREHYRAAAEIDGEVAAAWFGVYMAEKALGNEAAADSALQRAQGLAPGATLIHPGGDTTPPPNDGATE